MKIKDFIEVFYNEEIKTTSFAYVKDNKRLFGANNMKIGWHIHPFGDTEKHERIKIINIEKFLKMLEIELKRGNSSK